MASNEAGYAYLNNVLNITQGAVIQFDSWETVAWTSGSVASNEVHYDTRNYIVMGIGGAVMVTGLVLIANSGRPGRSLALEFAGDQPVLAYRAPF